jgi:DNA-binding response OmpR family regulator
MLSGTIVLFPREWRLTGAEARTILAFLGAENGALSVQDIFAASSLYSTMEDKHDGHNLIKVRISNLRKKVTKFGVEISTRRGFGYEISAASKAIIKSSLDRANCGAGSVAQAIETERVGNP